MENTKKGNKLFHNKYFKTLLIYTGLFSIISLFLIVIFKKYDKSFIWNNPDGLEQHIISLRYFRTLLIDFIRTGDFSTFTWNIGLGIDMFGNLAYYIFGDIFSYISILFPTNKIETLYSVLVIVRMYFAGISFLCYCKYKKMNLISSIIGTLMYTFSVYSIFSAVRHPYFINALVIFPLAMIGIEKIILEGKKTFYTITIAVTFIMNFYFAYMIALIIAIYGIILTIYTYKREGIKKISKILIKILLYSILGIMISGVILLPTGISFLTSERSASNTIYPYSISYYRNLFSSLLTTGSCGYWVILGVQSIILISLPIFIRKRKENYPLFLLTVILLLPLLISQIGSVFCGFGYPNNRWTFAMAFIFSFITTSFINSNTKIDKKNFQAIGIFVLLYIVINIIFEIEISFYTEIQIFIFILTLLVMTNKEKISNRFKKIRMYNILLITIFVVGIFSSIKYLFDVEGSNYVSQFLNVNELNKALETSRYTINDFDKAIDYINKRDDNFYKISKYPYDFENLALAKKYNSMGLYYSITPRAHGELSADLKNSQYYINYGVKEFDYRTKITTLLGVKYHIANKGNNIPYGYSLLSNYKGDSKIYINNYNLPFGVLYTNYITEEEYNKLNPLEKESSLLKTTVIDDKIISTSKIAHNDENDYTKTIEQVEYNIIDNNCIFSENNIVIKSTTKNSIKLNISEVRNSEIYVCFENLNYEPFTSQELIELSVNNKSSRNDKELVEEKYKWYQPNYTYKVNAKFKNVSKSMTVKDYLTHPYYVETPEILFNLGYYDKASGEITIQFTQRGNYSYDSIKVYAVSLEDYEDDIEKLRKSNFEVIEYGDGFLKGKVNSKEAGILQFSTIYDKGWKVYVDEKKVKTITSNKYFLGIEVESGEHTIYLKYNNPYIIPGFVITILAITILGISIIYEKNLGKIKK